MLKQPVGQKLLTNVAVVKLKKQNKKFELACYRNKVTDWRNKQENDVSQVLQIDQIFSDVETGTIAGKNDLKKFGKLSRDQIILEILNKGEFQMTDLERGDKLEKVKLDISNWISQQCINSENQNQFPSSIILRAMGEINCKVDHTKTAKQQALKIVGELKRVLPIERARMHIKVICKTAEQSEGFLKNLQEGHANDHTLNLERTNGTMIEVFLTIEKSLYRVVQDIMKNERDFYADVSVEIQDASTFDQSVQLAKQQQPAASSNEQAQSVEAAMSNLALAGTEQSQQEEEKKE